MLMIEKNIARHTGSITELPGRGIYIDLHFKHNQQISIIGIYLPASPGKERNSVTKWAIQHIWQRQQKDAHIIILGDFNSLLNPSKDKHSITNNKHKKKVSPTSQLLKFLQEANYSDTFHTCNPLLRKYTWSNSRDTHTRIDYIWITNNLINHLADSEIL